MNYFKDLENAVIKLELNKLREQIKSDTDLVITILNENDRLLKIIEESLICT